MNKTILAIALATSMGAQAAVTNVSTTEWDESCRGAVDYAREYAPSTDLTEVLNAQWKILSSEKVNDMEKMAGITLFMMYQRSAYQWEELMEKHGSVDAWDNVLYGICVDLLNEYEIVEKQGTPSTDMQIDSIY
jgi:hypothetical protein